MALTKKQKDKWLSALRSGKYKQGNGYLCEIRGNEKYHCCLGVLAEVVKAKQNGTKYIVSYNGKTGYFGSSDGFLTLQMESKLAHMNDDGQSFKEIASYISRNIKTKG